RSEEGGKGAQPVATGRQHAVRHAERRQDARDAAALLGSRDCEALAQRAAARVDANLASGLRIDEPEVAQVGQLLLARIADLDREYLVSAHHLEAGLAPVERAAEVRAADDDSALAP